MGGKIMGAKSNVLKYFFYFIIIIIPSIFFYVLMVSITQGDLRALITLSIFWVLGLIAIKYASNKYFKVLKYQGYIHLSMMVFLNTTIMLYISSFGEIPAIIYSCISYPIISCTFYKDNIISALYELGILRISFDKIKIKKLDRKFNFLLLSTRPIHLICYLKIPMIDVNKLLDVLPKVKINISIEFFSNGKMIPSCFLGVKLKGNNYDKTVENLNENIIELISLLEENNINYKTIRDPEELKSIYYNPLLFYKLPRYIPKLGYKKERGMNLEVQDNYQIQTNGTVNSLTISKLLFNSNQHFDILRLHKMIKKSVYNLEPFWFCINLDTWLPDELQYKRKELRSSFQNQIKYLDEELRLDEGKMRLAQVLSSTSEVGNAGVYNYLFKSDFENLMSIKKDILDFQNAEKQTGIWKTSFSLISPRHFLTEFEKFSNVTLEPMKSRESLHVLLRDPIITMDLTSDEVKNFCLINSK